MIQIDTLYLLISDCLKKYPDVLYGFSDTASYGADFKSALVFAVPHSKMLAINDYAEEKLEALICEARDRVNIILSEAEAVLLDNHIKYWIPPAAQTSEDTLVAPFSFKYAAVQAGLGWIGKNDALITTQYGPRVRLSALLIDHDLPKGKPITQSRCKDPCSACVNACPHLALSGLQWDIGKKRTELIDYQLCNTKRSIYIKTHHRKNACGLCLVSCPYGL